MQRRFLNLQNVWTFICHCHFALKYERCLCDVGWFSKTLIYPYSFVHRSHVWDLFRDVLIWILSMLIFWKVGIMESGNKTPFRGTHVCKSTRTEATGGRCGGLPSRGTRIFQAEKGRRKKSGRMISKLLQNIHLRESASTQTRTKLQTCLWNRGRDPRQELHPPSRYEGNYFCFSADSSIKVWKDFQVWECAIW